MALAWINGVQSQRVMTSESLCHGTFRRSGYRVHDEKIDTDNPDPKRKLSLVIRYGGRQSSVPGVPTYPGCYWMRSADFSDFVGNEQEHHRRSSNSVIDERTLHEIYLEPFRLQMKANPAVFVRAFSCLCWASLSPFTAWSCVSPFSLLCPSSPPPYSHLSLAPHYLIFNPQTPVTHISNHAFSLSIILPSTPILLPATASSW